MKKQEQKYIDAKLEEITEMISSLQEYVGEIEDQPDDDYQSKDFTMVFLAKNKSEVGDGYDMSQCIAGYGGDIFNLLSSSEVISGVLTAGMLKEVLDIE